MTLNINHYIIKLKSISNAFALILIFWGGFCLQQPAWDFEEKAFVEERLSHSSDTRDIAKLWCIKKCWQLSTKSKKPYKGDFVIHHVGYLVHLHVGHHVRLHVGHHVSKWCGKWYKKLCGRWYKYEVAKDTKKMWQMIQNMGWQMIEWQMKHNRRLHWLFENFADKNICFFFNFSFQF